MNVYSDLNSIDFYETYFQVTCDSVSTKLKNDF